MENITFNNYKIIQQLGQGGMATVYLAEDLRFKHPVAIKMLNGEFLSQPNTRNRFMAEARSMFRMSHPGIVRVIDLIEEQDRVAFVMEFVDGDTLKEYLEKNKKLSGEEISTIFSQMLDAVGYAHETGTVHRDIKPSNFIISKKGIVKLTDFGISKNSSLQQLDYDLTTTTQYMGTPMYMSPEQVKGAKNVLPGSDIYSLGVVLWQMVTGKKPYDATTLSTFELQTKIVNEPLGKTETAYDTVIAKATAKNGADRFFDITAFKKAMENIQVSTGKINRNGNNDDATVIETRDTNYHTGDTWKPNRQKRSNLKYYIGAVIAVGVGLLVYSLVSSNGKKESNSPQNYPANESYPVDSIKVANNSILSYIDSYGELVFKSDCYIIVEGAHATRDGARSHVKDYLQRRYSNAGYLWIPKYPSLSGKRNYATFIGPYDDYDEFIRDLQKMPKGEKFFYGKKVSLQPMVQGEIRF